MLKIQRLPKSGYHPQNSICWILKESKIPFAFLQKVPKSAPPTTPPKGSKIYTRNTWVNDACSCLLFCEVHEICHVTNLIGCLCMNLDCCCISFIEGTEGVGLFHFFSSFSFQSLHVRAGSYNLCWPYSWCESSWLCKWHLIPFARQILLSLLKFTILLILLNSSSLVEIWCVRSDPLTQFKKYCLNYFTTDFTTETTP